MKDLFSPFSYKGLELKNRVVMPPMCQYSVEKKDGIATDWHYVHYVSRAIGGAGLIIIEMTDVEPDGRITDNDLGLWSDEQIAPLKRIVDACHQYGAKVGIQIAHAGRKAEDAPQPVSASAIPFDDKSKTPRELTTHEVKEMVEKFRQTAARAIKAGFDTIEIHGAHGYLIHQFQSAYTNKRTDEYGQDLTKFGVEVIKAVKAEMPTDMPLIMRVSGKEYVEGGYDIEDSVAFSKKYEEAGVDIFHVSAGGEGPIAAAGRPGTHVAYQVPLARAFKQELNVPVIAVGRLDSAELANSVIGNEDADLVAVGRGMLRNPYWTIEAAAQLRKETEMPKQYAVAFPKR
ncbi:NADH:flavin oxidoreductase/NADH oxidase [Niallia circulans]|uniref:NADH:flavin oxidoreductase/NADH oxidase n=1 Tax=Niallia circulans TaxID=1397 RepID=UPI00077C7F67|nr:NADH:flavin oxidoreductase/NADH oxidase [Niallia circulans]MDR4316493.1 NADH:flavin oxidoreductase/NADH oxidase [Niallia circulans]MED3838334.1 NADH:flavin oxidoreductase/NADH oxidase [Niallia circulans]MED4243809.1 NADH:flavin oxidoreductase/NADH oxidase [Niallia circulans]MED4246201.1 NADH:flavin oxidoreductase/NADH oxidase [Niallia circulans]QKH63150.1 NADH:flavin oxidoreductase/NADH oxidase [Niallia circulans]